MADTYKTINCPACGQTMKKIFIPSVGISVDICADGCGGIYFDNQEMQIATKQQGDISEIREIIDRGNFKPVDESKIRVCPSCGQNMVKTPIKGLGVEIDTCYGCGGVFLDSGEYDAIRRGVKTNDTKKIEVQGSEISNDTLRSFYKEAQADNARLDMMNELASLISPRRHFDFGDLLWMIFR